MYPGIPLLLVIGRLQGRHLVPCDDKHDAFKFCGIEDLAQLSPKGAKATISVDSGKYTKFPSHL